MEIADQVFLVREIITLHKWCDLRNDECFFIPSTAGWLGLRETNV